MVLERISLNSVVEDLRLIATPRLTAEVIHLVHVRVLGVHETADLESRIPVQMLNTDGGESVHNDSIINVGQVQIESFLSVSSLGPRHSHTTGVQQTVHRQAQGGTAAGLVHLGVPPPVIHILVSDHGLIW
jgi:hypothetical protein